MSGGGDLASQILPFGIQVSDLEFIALWTFVAAVVISVIGILLLGSACTVGPTYHRPTAPTPQVYKESPPEGWKEAFLLYRSSSITFFERGWSPPS